jgi:hypothetical protein
MKLVDTTAFETESKDITDRVPAALNIVNDKMIKIPYILFEGGFPHLTLVASVK